MTKDQAPRGAAVNTTWKDTPTNTMVANGDQDVMVASSHSADMARRLPNSQLRIYPASGHGGVFQYHQEFVPEVLEFLER